MIARPDNEAKRDQSSAISFGSVRNTTVNIASTENMDRFLDEGIKSKLFVS